MSGFFPEMFEEMGARRRRLREAFGDRGQGIAEFLVLLGLGVGSLGLLVRGWMAAAAPWGFGVPVLFLLGYMVIEARRQRAIGAYLADPGSLNAELDAKAWQRRAQEMKTEDGADEDDLAKAKVAFDADAAKRRQARLENPSSVCAPAYDRAVFFWAFGCALLGAAAFAIAWSAQPANSHAQEDWRPPTSTVPTEIGP